MRSSPTKVAEPSPRYIIRYSTCPSPSISPLKALVTLARVSLGSSALSPYGFSSQLLMTKRAFVLFFMCSSGCCGEQRSHDRVASNGDAPAAPRRDRDAGPGASTEPAQLVRRECPAHHMGGGASRSGSRIAADRVADRPSFISFTRSRFSSTPRYCRSIIVLTSGGRSLPSASS